MEQIIERVMCRVLDDRKRVDEDTHSTHHLWVGNRIERDKKREELWLKVRAHVYGWGAVTVLAGFFYSFGEWVRHLLMAMFKAKGGP